MHDTVTGVRSLALDFEEVVGSLGSTPPVFASKPTTLQFTAGEDRGVVIIEKVSHAIFLLLLPLLHMP
jgi:hypothetical protein